MEGEILRLVQNGKNTNDHQKLFWSPKFVYMGWLFTSNCLAIKHKTMTPGLLLSPDKDLCAFHFCLDSYLDSSLYVQYCVLNNKKEKHS